MSLGFYRAFEDRYRGSRELILSRLRVYEPFIRPMPEICPGAPALDIGCGRGEWLELLGEAGLAAKGVDLDDGMLQACRERGLDVLHADGIAWLKKQADESLCMISAFHVAEHLPFGLLQDLVHEALRALRPGGLLILETPNPENLFVGSASFYSDPTHERPLPPILLAFLPEYAGFHRTTVLRLQESASLREATDAALTDVLFGVSPDYAVVAQKAGPAQALAALDAPFSAHVGLSLQDLSNRFDASWRDRLADIQGALQGLATRMAETDQRTEGLEDLALNDAHLYRQINALHARVDHSERSLHSGHQDLQNALRGLEHKIAQMRDDAERAPAEWLVRIAAFEDECAALRQERDRAIAQRLEFEAVSEHRARHIQALERSTSWRVTAPLRMVSRLLRRLPGAGRVARYLRDPAGHARLYVARRPRLRAFGARIVVHVPALHRRLAARLAPVAVPAARPSPPVVRVADAAQIEALHALLDRACLAAGRMPVRTLVLRGDLNSRSGYAKACTLYAGQMSAHFDLVLGADIHGHPARSFGSWPYPLIDDLLVPVLCARPSVQATVLTVSTPDNFVVHPMARNLGLFFWETDRLGNAAWIRHINGLDAMWVPAAFMKTMLEREGVQVPVLHVPCPLAGERVAVDAARADALALTDITAPDERSTSLAAVRQRYRHVLLCTNTFIPRKGFAVLLAQWHEVAARYPDTALVIKTSSIDVHETARSLHDKLRRLWRDTAPEAVVAGGVYVSCESLPGEQLQALEAASDAFVTTSYGEGLGLGLFDSLLAGKPVICGRHSSFEDMLPDDYPYFLDTEFANFGLPDPVGVYPVSARWGVPREGALLAVVERLRADLASRVAHAYVAAAASHVASTYRADFAEILP
ncbi:MAG: methyltransferase domain-containing protein [Rhodocyclaceae bacterium]